MTQQLQNVQEQKRQQFYTDPYSLKSFLIDSNTGTTLHTDLIGIKAKTYHIDISGCAKEPQRIEVAKRLSDPSMMPDISPRLKLRQDLIPSLMHEMKLDHFIPQSSPRDLLAQNTRRRNILTQMVSFNSDRKFGISQTEKSQEFDLSSDLRPQTQAIPETGIFNQRLKEGRSISTINKPRTDHILIIKNETKNPDFCPDQTDSRLTTRKGSISQTQYGQNSLLQSSRLTSVFKTHRNQQISTNSSCERDEIQQSQKQGFKTFSNFKAFEVNRSLLSNYESLQKNDVREQKVFGYIDQSRESYNDWQQYYANSQKKISAIGAAQSTAKTQTQPVVITQKTVKVDEVLPIAKSLASSPSRTTTPANLEEKALTPQPKRPINKLSKLDHFTAQQLFVEDQSATRIKKSLEQEYFEDHDYPFRGFKHIDLTGINEDQVKLSRRTCHDFDRVDKLANATQKPTLSKTNYEAYQKRAESRLRTKGLFQNDPQRLEIVKHPGDLQIQNQQELLKSNPTIKAYLEKQIKMDDKKLHNVKVSRIVMDKATMEKMHKQERQFIKLQRKKVMEMWMNPARPHQLQVQS